ncbi:AIPR family protein [Synechocystis sp. PCC 7339]|uniref:AIPR family protein n=1 Tax=Synechocystis sp. PCC 7339 TaxID=2782213 RepID=UPI001CC14FE1|nr:AIPR family protein [Synechocystis sp. PCC 7339]
MALQIHKLIQKGNKMSRVIVKQIASRLRELYATHIDTSDLSSSDKEFETKLSTRCIAAFAAHHFGECTEELAGKAVVDRGDDNGLDAVYYNPNTKRLTIVQSKFIQDGTGEPSANELRAFRDGIHDFLDGKVNKFNSKVQEKNTEISAVSTFGVKFDIVLAHTGKTKLANHGQQIVEEMMAGLNDDDDSNQNPVFRFHILSRSTIFSILSSDSTATSLNLEFHLKEWGQVAEPLKSYFGRINGVKVGEWWQIHGDRLLESNIRKMLGATPVNDQIADTAKTRPEYFWYFNNGITLLAESVEKTRENRDNRDFGYFKAEGATVVNGAQTVSVLGELFKSRVDLSTIEVPIRIIVVSGDTESLKKEITRTNNTQNEILAKDFISQDPIQDDLQRQIRLQGFQYQIKRDTLFIPSEKSFGLDEAIESMVILSKQPNLTAVFRKEVGRFHIYDKAPYKILFNPSTTGFFVINAVMIKRHATNFLEILREKLPEQDRSGRRAQIMLNGSLLVTQIAVRKIGWDQELVDSLQQFQWSIFDTILEDAVDKVFIYCEQKYAGSYLRLLFQNVAKCEDIYENIVF